MSSAEPLPTMAPAETPRQSAPPWSLLRRIGFRFAFSYLILYSFPAPLDSLPYLEWMGSVRRSLMAKGVTLLASHLFGLSLDANAGSSGSGDTTFGYVEQLLVLLLALVATLIWSLIDRRRRRYDRLWFGLNIYVRYLLAFIMLSYGFAKVFKLQFGAPSPGRLLETFGESSPMGLLWTFMGASRPYTIFGGLCEVGGGLLLFFRRTTLLGALVLTAVLTNIVMLNFCYDVPVKLYSSNLLLMALFLLLPDLGRLANLLLLARATPPPILRPYPLKRFSIPLRIVKGLIISFVLFTNGQESLERCKTLGDDAPKTALFGVYDVDPPAAGETSAGGKRMKRISIAPPSVYVWFEQGAIERFTFVDYPALGTFHLAPRSSEHGAGGTFNYPRADGEQLRLTGDLDGAPVNVPLKKIDTSKSLLMTRGFHFINEYPFNR